MQSDQNIYTPKRTKLYTIFSKFSRVAYASEPQAYIYESK